MRAIMQRRTLRAPLILHAVANFMNIIRLGIKRRADPTRVDMALPFGAKLHINAVFRHHVLAL